MEKKVIITQSMMKDYLEYHTGNACGLVFFEKYLNKNYALFKSSGVQSVGNYFEYQCIGANTKDDDKKNEPERTAKGELTAPFKRMEAHVKHFKMFISTYGIKILKVQEKLTVGETILQEIKPNTGEVIDWKIDGLEGTTDAICVAERDILGQFVVKNDNGKVERIDKPVIIKAGEEFIMDIKTSGLIYGGRYDDYSWNLDFLSTKDKLVRQPIHYKYLSQKLFGKQYKFLFLLFSQTNEVDWKAILFEIDEEEHIREHEQMIIWTNKWIKYNLKHGFKAHPEVSRCAECPLKVGCKHFAAVPPIEVFYYQPQRN